MKMKPSTLIGLILLVGLFVWSMTMSTSRAEEQAAAQRAKAEVAQTAKARSGSLQVPELTSFDSTKLCLLYTSPSPRD